MRKSPALHALRLELQKVLDAGSFDRLGSSSADLSPASAQPIPRHPCPPAGISSVAVVLKHAAIFPQHEQAVGQLAREMGFRQVSLSSAVMPMVKMVPRGFTAAADAYLTPHIMRWVPAAEPLLVVAAVNGVHACQGIGRSVVLD